MAEAEPFPGGGGLLSLPDVRRESEKEERGLQKPPFFLRRTKQGTGCGPHGCKGQGLGIWVPSRDGFEPRPYKVRRRSDQSLALIAQRRRRTGAGAGRRSAPRELTGRGDKHRAASSQKQATSKGSPPHRILRTRRYWEALPASLPVPPAWDAGREVEGREGDSSGTEEEFL